MSALIVLRSTKACTALAEATNELDIGAVDAGTPIIIGEGDKLSLPVVCEEYAKNLESKSVGVKVFSDAEHWHV